MQNTQQNAVVRPNVNGPTLAQYLFRNKDVRTASIEALRSEYRMIRAISEADTPNEFDRVIAARLAISGIVSPTPAQYVLAARDAAFGCRRCGQTGRFITMMVNGQPTGPNNEPCFRCEGHGVQVDSDARRNAYYDAHRIVRI